MSGYLEIFLGALRSALGITALVVVMMALIELVNIWTQGRALGGLGRHTLPQVLLGGLLGALPGCMGGYAVVSMYTHRVLSFGSLMAMMVATCGDEAFLMLALFPGRAIAIMGGLLALGVVIGLALDRLPERFRTSGGDTQCPDGYSLHSEDARSELDHHHHGQGRHFVVEHLLHHVVRRHAPRVFLWSFGTLLLLGVLTHGLDINAWISDNTVLMIALASLVGLIPQSGPHMVFVTLFASGVVPLPVLVASCISQNGHAPLPLLAESKRAFVSAKAICLLLALLAGFALRALA